MAGAWNLTLQLDPYAPDEVPVGSQGPDQTLIGIETPWDEWPKPSTWDAFTSTFVNPPREQA